MSGGGERAPAGDAAAKPWRERLAGHWGWIALVAVVCGFYWDWMLGRAFIWEDLVYQWWPALGHLSNALAEGRLPLWNPGLRCGMPFFSDVQVGAFYLPHWLFVVPESEGRVPWLLYQWYLVAHVFVAGLGTHLFLREQGLRQAACVTAGATFALGAFMTMQMTHGPFMMSMSWVPLAMFWLRRAEVAGRRSALLGAGVAIGLSFLAGAPQVTLYAGLMIVAYWFFLAATRAPGGARERATACGAAAIRMGVVFGLVLLVGGVVLLPSLADWGGSARSEYSFEQIADNSVPWYYLPTLAFPNFFGISNATGEGVRFWGINRDSIEFQTWKMAPWQYWEFAGYAGQLALCGIALGIAGWRSGKGRPEVRFFVVWAFFCLWFMMGRYGGLFRLLYEVVPGIGMFRSPSRMSCGLTFAGAVLAGHLVDMVLRGEGLALIKRVFQVAFFGCLGLLLLFVSVGQGWSEAFKDPANFDGASFEIARAALINGVLLFWVGDIARGGRTLKGLLVPALPVCVVAVDLYLAHAHFHRGRQNPEEYYADRGGVVPQLRELQGREGPVRFAQLREGRLSEEVIFPRNAGYIYPGLEVPEGYVTFTPKRLSEFLGMRNEGAKLAIINARVVANVSGGGVAMGVNTNALPRAQVYHEGEGFGSWKELLAALEGGRLDYRRKLGWIRGEADEAGDILAGGPETPEVVVVEREAPERMRLRTRMAAPGAIFVSQTYYPGWRANDASGQSLRVLPAFGAFTAILVPAAGEAEIEFEYRPREFVWGLMLSAVGLAGAGGLWWAARRREPKTA